MFPHFQLVVDDYDVVLILFEYLSISEVSTLGKYGICFCSFFRFALQKRMVLRWRKTWIVEEHRSNNSDCLFSAKESFVLNGCETPEHSISSQFTKPIK